VGLKAFDPFGLNHSTFEIDDSMIDWTFASSISLLFFVFAFSFSTLALDPLLELMAL
jgi:hypothetical protein